MGYNTTIVLMNDALHDIANDESFGGKLSSAVKHHYVKNKPIDVSANSFANAATVLGTEHSSVVIPYLIGGNIGKKVDKIYLSWNDDSKEEKLLKLLAAKLGYSLRKK